MEQEERDVLDGINSKKIKDRNFHYRKFMSGEVEIGRSTFDTLYDRLNNLTERVDPQPFIYIYHYVTYSIEIVKDTIILKRDINEIITSYCYYLYNFRDIYEKIIESRIFELGNLKAGKIHRYNFLAYIAGEIADYCISVDAPTGKYKMNQWCQRIKLFKSELKKLKRMREIYIGGIQEGIKKLIDNEINFLKSYIKEAEVRTKGLQKNYPFNSSTTRPKDFDFSILFLTLFFFMKSHIVGLSNRKICGTIKQLFDVLDMTKELDEDALLKRLDKKRDLGIFLKKTSTAPKMQEEKFVEPKTFFDQLITKEKTLFQERNNELREEGIKHGVKIHYEDLNLDLFEETARKIYKRLLTRAIEEKQIYPKEVLGSI